MQVHHFDPHIHHHSETSYAPGTLPSTVPYFHDAINNYVPNQEGFPTYNWHGGGEVGPTIQGHSLDLLECSLHEYEKPYDAIDEGNYHKTLAGRYQKPRTQVPVPTVDVIPHTVCVSYFD